MRLYEFIQNRLVGYLIKESSGATRFQYDESCLNRRNNWAISISLPLREDAYHGGSVEAIFFSMHLSLKSETVIIFFRPASNCCQATYIS